MDVIYRILFPFMIFLGATKGIPGFQSLVSRTSNDAMVDADILYKQLKSYGPNCKSLLKKHLTQDVFDKLKNKTTSYGGTLADCIRSGCLHMDNVIGLYASDPDAYIVFSDIFDPVLKDYHDASELKHPEQDLGNLKNLPFADLNPSGGMIVSTTIQSRRSIANYGFPPTLRKGDREDMENITVEALKTLQDELKGSYYPLLGMTQEDKKKMDDDHFLFQDDDRYGYLTFCPTNIGTTCRSSIRIKIPNLSKHKDFNDVCERLYLQKQGVRKGNSRSKDGVYDISNKRRLGLTEIETLEEFSIGVVEIIELEKKLASGGKI